MKSLSGIHFNFRWTDFAQQKT